MRKSVLKTLYIILVLAVTGMASAAARAGESYIDYTIKPFYDAMTMELIQKGPRGFNFTMLRRQYLETTYYDPLGDTTREAMLKLAYQVQNEKDQAKAAQALEKYKLLVKNHLANVGIVAEAGALAREDKRFGNPDFFLGIREGLMHDVLGSGDGYTLAGAYHALTMAEETMLMAALRLQVVKTVPAQSGFVYYNMHDVVNADTGEPRSVFVDVSIPMRFMEHKRGEMSKALDLRHGDPNR